ncbi:hypothetical protein VB636_07355 [Paracoccus sp. APAP_BH8]|uniref:hypothetical protein n=1 Tax=unclassified Paracoccus (in: a-proteobacteria) TaxID=2688777 RepID=UPI002FD7CA65
MNHAVERVRDSRLRLGNIFQSCASDINYAQGLVRFVAGLGPQTALARRLAVVVPKAKAMDMGMAALAEGLDRQGWQLQPMPVDTAEPDCWQRVVTGLHQLEPGVVRPASFFVEDAIPFQRAFRDNPVRALVYLIYSPRRPAIARNLAGWARG